MNTRFAALLTLATVATLPAQDPPVPPGGFGVVVNADNPVVWSDGFRTRMDIYRPAVAPPATGWPCVMIEHGGGGHRKKPEVVKACNDLADHGYVCFSYDVRGDGGTPGWNPGFPHPITQERTLIDAAESWGIAQTLSAAGTIDPNRLAATGFSQGGSHAADAAAWSGRVLPPDPSGAVPFVTHYPTILAVAPENHNFAKIAKSMPGGVLVNDELIDDRVAGDPLLTLLNAGDYAGGRAWIQSSFGAGSLALLQTSRVPMFAMFAWQDFKHQLNAAADALPTLRAGVPRRLLLTTGGHSTPKNHIERNVLAEMRRRWFDHFLKGIANGVTAEARVEIAVQQGQPGYSDLSSHMAHRQHDIWPPTGLEVSFHLRENGALTRTAPPTTESGPLFRHRVRPGYDLVTYVQDRASKHWSRLAGNISRERHVFETAPFPAAAEVFGRVHVDLAVDDTSGTTQLSVTLAHVAPDGTEHFITFGTGGIRDQAAGRHALRFDLGDIAHVVPAGHRLRATMTNLATHRTANYDRIRFAPYFTDTDTTIVLDPNAPSRIEVPLRPFAPTLTPRLGYASAASGIDHTLRLDGGAARAGQPYFTFLSASGEAPGVSIPGFPHVPLNLDAWTSLGIALQNTAAFPAFVGLLDAQGRATPAVRLPAGPAANVLLGLRLTFAGLCVDSSFAPESAFGPTTLVVEP